MAAKPLIVGDPCFYVGQVPLVVSEWGGFGFVAYGGPDGSEEKAARQCRRRLHAGDQDRG